MRRAATPAMIVGGSLAFVGIVIGLYYGTRTAEHPAGDTSAVVAWPDGGAPPDARCVLTTGVASAAALQLFGISNPGGGSGYVYCSVCASPEADAGLNPELPSGMEALAAYQEEVDYDGGPQLVCWRADIAPWPCACYPVPGALPDGGTWDAGSGAGPCEWKPDENAVYAAGPAGVTLATGAWRGGCRPKSCVELAGVHSWPVECGPP